MKTLKEFVNKSINEIEEGLPEGYKLNSKIDFELSVVATSKAKGGADILVASVGGHRESSNLQKIRFSVTNKITEKQEKEDGIKLVGDFLEVIAELDQNHKRVKRIN
ncbi:MAG: hypothetical protein D4R88_09915 [Methanosarcinales archaeon]|nr:MAG: hypothetical protein D4R88_09915 [Methanosarcinales archaeon]